MRTQTGEPKWCRPCAAGCAGLLLIAGAGSVHAAQTGRATAQAIPERELPAAVRKLLAEQSEELRAVRREMAAQRKLLQHQERRIDELQHALANEQKEYASLRESIDTGALAAQRAGAAPPEKSENAQPMPEPDGTEPYTAADVAPEPVGAAPPTSDNRPPAVAPIFDQPGVLTPRGKFVLEPSYQFGYSSTNRVALIGYTIIPALVIGLIDVRQVRVTTQIAELTMRYGLTNRMEAEVRVPYVDAHTDTTSREIFTGSATDQVFTTNGKGIGDLEATLRYQFNDGGADRPYYIGWMRFKSRTGRDPFEVTTDCVQRCVENTTGTGLPLEMPMAMRQCFQHYCALYIVQRHADLELNRIGAAHRYIDGLRVDDHGVGALPQIRGSALQRLFGFQCIDFGVVAGEDVHALHHMTQFPHVAWPGAPAELAQDVVIHALAGAIPGIQKIQEVLRKQRDVLTALAQRRHRKRKFQQPEIEIRTQSSHLDHVLEITIRRGDHPYVDRNFA
jgi:hypothetical protein